MSASGNIPPPDAQEPADLLQLALPVSQKVVLVIDLVESVRLMAADEAGTVARWHDFAQTAQNHTIPAHQGRLVKSLGDGLMVEFENPRDAANAAHTLHAVMQKGNAGQSAERQMHLRAGINATHVYTDHNDIYGAGVNLAARIATLAGPGETVVTAQVRDGLTDGLDATIEDLGECYLKHIDEPVRTYRIGAAGQAPVVVAQREYATPLQPTIAVIPFGARSNQPEHIAIGELIADGVIGQISKFPDLRVISRMSTTLFRNRPGPIDQVGQHLAASYLLNGSYLMSGARLLVNVELADPKTGQVVWVERLEGTLADLLSIDSQICTAISQGVAAAVIAKEVHEATTRPLPTLQSYSLMLGAIALMHRATSKEFGQARQMLNRLGELHRRHAQPFAWLGKWHILQVAQGWSSNTNQDSVEALKYCDRALEIDSNSSLALAVTGQVHGFMRKDLASAETYYHQAIAVNPSEPLAWLWLGMSKGFRHAGDDSMEAIERALKLSPLDPLRYYYHSLAASTAACCGHFDRAIELATSSIRLNRTHVSTYRALAIAQALSGKTTEARATAALLLAYEHGYTVHQFIDRFPARLEAPDHMYALAEGLRIAGVPD